jgi:hypothetical protein
MLYDDWLKKIVPGAVDGFREEMIRRYNYEPTYLIHCERVYKNKPEYQELVAWLKANIGQFGRDWMEVGYLGDNLVYRIGFSEEDKAMLFRLTYGVSDKL